LAVFHDIEEQLRVSREHEQQMFQVKESLQKELIQAGSFI
jgi:hypothetical protein